jgi:hypothetical protein
MSDIKIPMTPKEEDKNAGVARLEDGTAYPLDGYIKVETKEYHQTTHYLNRQIAVEDIIMSLVIYLSLKKVYTLIGLPIIMLVKKIKT